MLQTCQKCSHESPTGDRYCRQCGEPFVVETGASGAATRNYVKQEPQPVANAGSGYFPPSVADAIVGDTERYYQSNYQPPQMPVPPAQYTPQFKKRSWRWRGFLWFLALFLSAMVGSIVTIPLVSEPERTPVSAEESRRIRAEEEARGREERQRNELQDKMREAKERSDQAQERSKEAIERFREAYEQAVEVGTKIASSVEKPLDLTEYEYTGASSINANRIPGYEMMTIRTSDNFDAIKQFYKNKIGLPIIEFNDEFEGWLLFQTKKAPSMIVYVDSEFPDQRRIVVMRYPFPIIPLEDTQNKN
jgi:hypothetical protein